MKKIIITFLISFFILFLPLSVQAQNSIDRYEAEITKIQNGNVTVKILNADKEGKEYSVTLFDEKQLAAQNLNVGDKVIVSFITGMNQEPTVIIEDHVRRTPLLILTILFIGIVLWVGRVKGLFSLLAMIFSFFIIAQFIIPQILLGNDPLLISLLGALFIIPALFYISHGFKKQTTIAVVSTFLALIITGTLAYIFVIFAKLTGFAAEEATFIQAIQGESLNIQSLLLAGIIIGAMGVLDDITISQTSIVEKLWKANPKYTRLHVFQEAMDIGRDHIASLVNTLVLVYAGAALPLFVLFYSSQFGSYQEVVNMELIATEIVRTLVASIGIIAAVPITTLLSTWYLRKSKAS